MKVFIPFFVLCFSALSSANSSGLQSAFHQSAAGMKTQSERMKVVSQNIANAESTGDTPGAEPYKRKIIFFENKFDKKLGTETVRTKKVIRDDKSEFKAKFDPSHPAADENGYVLLPNVKTSIETLDIKEAQRSYEANLGAIETTKRMFFSTVDLLR